MNWKPFTHILIAAVLAVNPALAQAPEELQELVLTGDLYGRSSVDFRSGANNIKYMVPEGSEGTVVETRKLSRTGSYGIKIRITKVGKSSERNVPNVGDETWVYFSQKDPWLTFKDREGSEVQDPEVALTSKAQQNGSGVAKEGIETAIHLPTKEEVLREQKAEVSADPNLPRRSDRTQTEGDFCTTCEIRTPNLAQQNRDALQAIHSKIEATTPEKPDSKWGNYPTVSAYSTSKEVRDSISYGIRNKEKRTKRLCYRYVKRALLAGGLVEDYLPGSQARYGVSDLKRRGFTNMLEDPRFKDLIKSPEDAPKGAILIYKNTQNSTHPGHAEIKTDWGDKGGYVSDFFRTSKQPMANRKLIGVMIKEEAQ